MRPNKLFYILIFSVIASVTLWSQIPEDEIVITASSTLPASGTANFSPDNLMDGSSASWSEGAPGNGVGEFFVFDFRYPDKMRYVVIKNGYGVDRYWGANARMKKLKVTDREGSSRILHLEDTPELRVYGLTALVEDEYGTLQRGEPLSGSYYTFEILDVYEGSRWEDACITEVMVNEWYTEHFPMDTGYLYKLLFMEYLNGVPRGDGTLYIPTDWEGYVPVDVGDGYYYEEIVSGDGTGGFREHRLFLDEAARDYYLFISEHLSQPDQATMEGLNADTGPTFDDLFTREFLKYDPVSESFIDLNYDQLEHLFDEDPLTILSRQVGTELMPEEVGVRFDSPSAARFFYPPSGETEAEVWYRWNGERLIKEIS
jgi:hypothetical protein